MFRWLTTRREPLAQAKHLYGTVVTAALRPEVFGPARVADTPEGRVEVLVLHMVLVLERLRAGAPATDEAARHLVEAFVEDMDDSMREMGVGDMTVPRKVKKAAAALYDRTLAYRPVLDARDAAALAVLLAQHLPGAAREQGAAPNGGPDVAIDAEALARYALAAADALAATPLPDIEAGRLGLGELGVV